jgi:hypothetical protein
MRFKKSGGVNESEALLAQVCENAFLHLWTYPNVFRSKAKELTDLLIVFENSVVIISDKSCSYPNTGSQILDWTRWCRKSLIESAAQLNRAENWLLHYPKKIFLDAKCEQPLPIEIPDSKNIKIYKICVALGASGRLLQETGRTSLRIEPNVIDDEKIFSVGKLSTCKGWVHVFGKDELLLTLSLIDTAADFIEYLAKREALLNNDKFALAESEEDLVAYYLWHNRDFKIKSEEPFKIEPNLLQKLLANRSFQAGKSEDQVSYFWDSLIEHFNEHFLNETLDFGGDLLPSEHEKGIRILARETRFSRRILSNWILARAEKAPNEYVASAMKSSVQADVTYVLLIGPGAAKPEYEEYRSFRQNRLTLRCYAAKAKFPSSRFIVGLALDARGVVDQSEDLQIIDTAAWTNAEVEQAEKTAIKLGYFVGDHTTISAIEYPEG